MRIGAEVEIDVFFMGQAASDRFADHGLVVDQQHHGGIFRQFDVVDL